MDPYDLQFHALLRTPHEEFGPQPHPRGKNKGNMNKAGRILLFGVGGEGGGVLKMNDPGIFSHYKFWYFLVLEYFYYDHQYPGKFHKRPEVVLTRML